MMLTRIFLHRRQPRPGPGEEGFVLVTALIVLLLLLVLGITSIDRSNVEVLIAGNEKWYAKGFYNADGGGEVGAMLVEENLSCPEGFAGTLVGTDNVPGNRIKIDNLTFWQNNLVDLPLASRAAPFVEDHNLNGKRDAYYPQNYLAVPASPAPHTNLRFSGVTEFGKGAALQQAAGYEGRGKGAGSGGSLMLIDIYSQYIGPTQDNTTVLLQWRHVVGTEGSCNY